MRARKSSVRTGLVPASREGGVQLSRAQRARILTAMAEVVAEHGVGSTTVTRVVTRAGVSRRTFYDQFTGCEDCFLAVFDNAVERVSEVASEAVAAARSSVWREQVRTGLAALLAFCEEEPALGSLLVVEALGAGPQALKRRARVVEKLVAIVDRGRSQAHRRGAIRSQAHGRGAVSSRGATSSSASSPPLTAEGVVGAVLSVIHARMIGYGSQDLNGTRSSQRSRQMPADSMLNLLNPLMGMIVLPYLGRSASQKELARPAPKLPRERRTPRSPRRADGNPLESLNMRLTYRTLKVLSVIATIPGASNRQVADGAGIHDQGQISKLLTRLERLQLIHNDGAGQLHGAPNAWILTAKGDDIQRALTAGR